MAEVFEPPAGWRTSPAEMPALISQTDWAATPLGPRALWSASLTLALDMVLASAFPMALRWGPDFVLIYNDGYVPILGDKHPWALGRPAREAWSEVWAQIEPVHRAILENRAPAVFADDMLLRIKRHGERFEDARFTLGYSQVKDETAASGVGGILVTAIETTARFDAEKALRASEERYELALSTAGVVGTWDWDIVADRVIANKKFAQMYSVDPGEAAVGAPIERFIGGIHPDDRTRVGEEINQSIESGAPFASEYRLQQVDGTVVWVFAGGQAHRDSTGKVVRLAGTTVDISARRQAEAELARSEAEFRGFAQAMPNHVWASAPNGLLDWFNEQVYLYGGAKEGELDGAGWARMVHPDDIDAASQSWAAALKSGEVYQTEFRLQRADGVYRWHIARAVPLRDERDTIIRWIGTNTDIEEQKAASEALRDLNQTLARRVSEEAAERDRVWQTSQDVLAVVDPSGIFCAANPAWTKLLGWPIDEVVGRHHLELNHPDDHHASDDALTHAQRAPLQNYESRILHKDGSFRWFSWVASEDQGMVYASGRDITAEKEAETELQATQEALRQSQKMEAVGQLTGGIAHDFNNLLAAMGGSFSLIERRLADGKPGIDRYISSGQDAVRRAASLTQRLLAFSRRQTLDPVPTDTNKLIAGMEELIRRSVGPTVQVEVVGAVGLWATRVDQSQLESALLNLCINARDAMAPGGGRMIIETANKWLDERVARERDLKPGQYVSLCVTDTGVGMDAETIERAFDPFFTTKPLGQGTGLGLSMVYGFTRQSGGQVRIYSEIGKGTTMCLYLPRYVGQVEEEQPHEVDALEHATIGETILVIDDEPTLRMLMTDVLEEAGYHVLQAGTGPDGLRILQSEARIDLLVTDVGLPGGVNGRQVADAARVKRPKLGVLFITGYADNAAVGNGCLEAGMEVLTKPFEIASLANKVREMLDR